MIVWLLNGQGEKTKPEFKKINNKHNPNSIIPQDLSICRYCQATLLGRLMLKTTDHKFLF